MAANQLFWRVIDAFYQREGRTIAQFLNSKPSNTTEKKVYYAEPPVSDYSLVVSFLEKAKYEVTASVEPLPDFVGHGTSDRYSFLVSEKAKEVLHTANIFYCEFASATLPVGSTNYHYYFPVINSLANEYIDYSQSIFIEQEKESGREIRRHQFVSYDDYEKFKNLQLSPYHEAIMSYGMKLIKKHEKLGSQEKLDIKKHIEGKFTELLPKSELLMHQIALQPTFNLDWFRFYNYFYENTYISNDLKEKLEEKQCSGLIFEKADEIYYPNT